ncbi:UTP--glucose-1-phosphate uridylyltransferase [Patescibacteria group bacterium]|nr:UTP--glucose-1-phosphate uridylyltransferase [Patescibacteria group bacterium]
MSNEIKKAIIPVAGLGTRFLPLSKILPKEFFPIVDKPIIQYIVEEAKKSGITELIFVISPTQKMILNYFKPAKELEKILTKKKKEELLKELKEFESILNDLTIHFVIQRKPMGDGHAILQAEKLINNEPVAVLFSDDIVDGETPAISQLIDIYRTCNAPVIALNRLPNEKLPAYGVAGVEKIASRLYKVKKIIEKPALGEAPSDLVIVGKYILTPEVFAYLKKARPSKKGEIILAEVFEKMLMDGKVIYGYEFKGKWLECGDKLKWLKSFLYFAMKDNRFGPDLRKYLKDIK